MDQAAGTAAISKTKIVCHGLLVAVVQAATQVAVVQQEAAVSAAEAAAAVRPQVQLMVEVALAAEVTYSVKALVVQPVVALWPSISRCASQYTML